MTFLGRQGEARLAELGGAARAALRHRARRARADAPGAAGALSVLETRGGYVLLASEAGRREDAPRERPRAPRPVLLVLALGALLYLPGLGREILRHPLEAKYALAAREMVRGGPWLVAHLFGEIYPGQAAALLLGHRGRGRAPGRTARRGVGPAPRGPGRAREPRRSRCSSARRSSGARAGLIGAAVLATSGLFFWYARQGHPDQFLIAGVTLACLGLWRSFTTLAGTAPHRLDRARVRGDGARRR